MYYQRHIFFCTNKKTDGAGCSSFGSIEAFNFSRTYLKELGQSGAGMIRSSKSGCMGRCELGPVCVVYPEGIWYTYIDSADVKLIIDQHLLQGSIVEKLQLKS